MVYQTQVDGAKFVSFKKEGECSDFVLFAGRSDGKKTSLRVRRREPYTSGISMFDCLVAVWLPVSALSYAYCVRAKIHLIVVPWPGTSSVLVCPRELHKANCSTGCPI